MTKALEMEHLRAFIQSLPKDTYLRPWLEENLALIERDITDDFCISPSVTESMKTAQRTIKEGQTSAEAIIAAAHAKAAKIVEAAEAQSENTERVQRRVANFLNSAANRLYEV